MDNQHRKMKKNGGYTVATGRWKPIRNGTIFCSSACGGGCKFVDYRAAVLDAEALAKQLGEGWHPRVWENIGWFFSADKDGTADAQMRKVRRGYMLYANGGPKQIVGEGRTPKSTLRNTVKLLRDHIEGMQAALFGLQH